MWLKLLKQLWRAMIARLQTLIGESGGTTLAVTGILGLAVVYTLFYLRRGPGRKPDEQGAQQQQQQVHDPTKPSTSAAAAAAAAAAAVPQLAAATSPAARVARRLFGVQRVTMSVPGVLLEESSPQELEESASARAGAVVLAREMVRCCPSGLYLICHVDDDLGEAVVRGALEHASLLGNGPDQVAPHRLLFCSTLLGKVSMVRQLEPEMHIDDHPQTVSDLQRFVKQLVLVQPPGAQKQLAGSSAATAAAVNVQHTSSLAVAMGVPPA